MNDQYENDGQQSKQQNQSDKSAIENLIQLSEKNSAVNTSDLNSHLQEIDKELRHLNAREAATSKAFRELLSENKKHSSEQNEQLTETREQITDIKQKYQKLTQDYQRLAAGANLLSVTLEQARSEISTDIESLRLSTQERTDQLADGQLQMIERANRIESKAAQMAEDLDSRVNVIRSTISALESRLSEEIREVAAQSEQRDEALNIRINMVEENLAQETDKLRQVDEEQAEQISTLQSQTGVLSKQTEDLQFQSNILDTRSTDLEERSDELEQATEKHAALLSHAHETIDRHHKGFAIALVLIVVTLGILSVLQQNRWNQTTDADVALKEQVSAQQQTLATQNAAQQETTARLEALESQSQESHATLIATDEKVTTAISQLEQNVKALNEKADNNASRMSAMTPNRTFGTDNTIHTAEWLAQQDPQQYVIKVATLNSKQELYTLAYRWSTLFNQSKLSFVEKQQADKTVYTLVYGTFADKAQAEWISRTLPIVNYGFRPEATKLAELL